jgi:hypothetical protein
MTEIHRIVLMIIDHDGLGVEECAATLERTRYPNYCIHPQVFSAEVVAEVEWDDSDALNRRDGWKEAFASILELSGEKMFAPNAVKAFATLTESPYTAKAVTDALERLLSRNSDTLPSHLGTVHDLWDFGVKHGILSENEDGLVTVNVDQVGK